MPSTEVSRVAAEIRTIKTADAAVRRRVGETERLPEVKLSSQIPELRILANYVDQCGDRHSAHFLLMTMWSRNLWSLVKLIHHGVGKSSLFSARSR
jgi:hypothetical protein